MIITSRYLKKYTLSEKLTFFRNGEKYFLTLIDLIEKAQKEIHLQIYILCDDVIGNKVSNALIKAANKGVKVYLVLDAHGSKELSTEFIEKLKTAKIIIRFFSPINLFKFKFWRRLHQKVLVVDRQFVMIGGINIADRYHGNQENPPWLDFAVLVEGKIAEEAARLCFNILKYRFYRSRIKNKTKTTTNKDSILVSIRQHDIFRRKKNISTGYKYAIRHAEKSITIFASYFFPGRQILRLLRKASQRGVKITLVLSSQTDVAILKRAMNHLYFWLFRKNIIIYEYQATVIHAKVAIVDNQWLTIGSYNLNHLSEYGSIELNVDIIDKNWVSQVNAIFEQIIKNECSIVNPENYFKKKKIVGRIIDSIAYYTMHSVFWLIMYMSKKEIKGK